MNTFTKKTLYAAIAGAATIGVAGTAQAVNISADGLGQVLIYPYYTVNPNSNGQAFNTLMSVVNTTASVKAVKVRFREGRNSVEVLDFNVFLSPFDVWTASITPTATGGGQISTTDKSCTIPSFTSGVPVPFRTLSLESTDNADTRTAEGYFEIFEMGTYPVASPTGIKATHVAGVPPCGITDNSAGLPPFTDIQAPTGGIFGGVTIVNPAGGGAFSQPATALANFTTNGVYFTTGNTSPKYEDASPAVSNVIQGGTLYSSVWTTGQNAVTATLLGNAITNEYVLDAGSRSATSWIITMPTKYAYVNGAAIPPFTKTYVTKVGACEPTFPVVFNREEASPQVVSNTDFSPQVPGTPGPTICWESTAINFSNPTVTPTSGVSAGNIFGSNNANTLSTPYTNGWAVFGFNDPTTTAVHSMTPVAGQTLAFNLQTGAVTGPNVVYYGLPVVGFAAQTFNNDAIVVSGKTYLSTFGVDFVHHKTTKIQ